MELWRITLIINLWLLSSLNASAFNLDNTNVLRKNGAPGSLFGYSLAMHHQLKPTDQQLLLIGAPHAKALPSQKANITGGLYRCKFTTQSDDCERIPIDTEDARPGQGLDHRENQWMGVHVKSQGPGGKVVVCAHRYQQWIHNNQLVLGRCFILEQNLIVEDTRTFCRNRANSKDRFGYCQQGVSAAFTKNKKYIVFSGPGAYDWKGTVRMEPVEDFLLDPYETGDQNTFNEWSIPLTLSSYLGFALDSGMNLLKKEEQVVVAGAPRSNHSGEVLILKPDDGVDERSLRVAHILRGPGLASSFGYSLVVIDLNADGWDDLVVGAPQYSTTDKEAGTGGAVYVYINRRDSQDWDRLQPDVLTGNKDSMFGLAVANIGDINHDGYNDFAVGAPYDSDGDGAVYIYLGKTGHFSQKDNQVLLGKTHKIKLFGYSLAGNTDIDGNGYPDLAVGSLSDSVLVYRAKPVISIEKSLTLVPSEMNFQERDCQKIHCIITAKSCFSYTTYPATYNPRLQIHYKLNADEQWVQDGHQSRLVYQDNQEGNIVLQTPGQKECVKNQLKLRANTENKLTEIPVSVSVSLPQNSPRQRLSQSSLPALQPALDDLQPRESTAKFMFLNPDCGSDDVCQSNLQLQYNFCTKDQHQDSCSPLARENGVAVISPGSGNTALEITITNHGGDDAHLAQLVANFPESLPLSSVILKQDSKVNIQCDVDGSKTRAECNLGNPFKRDGEGTFYLLLNTDRLTPSITDVNVTLNLQTISVQNISEIVAEAQVFFELYLQVFGLAKPSQVYFQEMKNKSDEEIGEPVQYEFTISNMGRPLKSFASATLNIQWPKENKEGKWLLYLLQITGPNNQSIPCTPASEISPIRHPQEVKSREKREAEGEAKVSALSTGGLLSLFGRHYKYLTCGDELKCVELRCPLKAADRTAVTLYSRLWSSTFVEDYSSLNYLDIVLNASLSLDGSQKNIRLQESQTQVRLTVFPKKKPTFLSRVPWWVGLLSVVLALLLISLLIYFLSKLGCLDCAMCTEDNEYKN